MSTPNRFVVDFGGSPLHHHRMYTELETSLPTLMLHQDHGDFTRDSDVLTPVQPQNSQALRRSEISATENGDSRIGLKTLMKRAGDAIVADLEMRQIHRSDRMRSAAWICATITLVHEKRMQRPGDWALIRDASGITTISTAKSPALETVKVVFADHPRPTTTLSTWAAGVAWGHHTHGDQGLSVEALVEIILDAGGVEKIAQLWKKQNPGHGNPEKAANNYRTALQKLSPPIPLQAELSSVTGNRVLALLERSRGGGFVCHVIDQEPERVRRTVVRAVHEVTTEGVPKAPRRAAGDHQLRRKDRPRTSSGAFGWPLEATHPAMVANQTVYKDKVVQVEETSNPLKSGVHSQKLGGLVLKGPLRGARIYSLTLEERKTCPSTCSNLATCYGNNMHWPDRHAHGPELEAAIDRQLSELFQKPTPLLIRLHTLGDFYSVEYVRVWETQLDRHPNLHVFGYTHWGPDTEIGTAVLDLAWRRWGRFRIRLSGHKREDFPDIDHPRATVVEGLHSGRHPAGIVCPEQTDGVTCGECGLCWAGDGIDDRKRVNDIVFLAH